MLNGAKYEEEVRYEKARAWEDASGLAREMMYELMIRYRSGQVCSMPQSYVYIYIYIYTHMYMCIYIYIYIHIYMLGLDDLVH